MAQILDKPFTWDYFQAFMDFSDRSIMCKDLMQELLYQHGAFFFSKAVQEGLLKVQKLTQGSHQIRVPIREHPEDRDPEDCILHFGQLYNEPTGDNEWFEYPLHGIGRKITLWSHGGDIEEGQFVDNYLHGFGRKIDVQWHGTYTVYVGHWVMGEMHGFGR
jgi:hypothetical protein